MPDVDRFGRLPWLWITVLVFVLDQVSKAFFQAELSMYQQIVVIPDLFSWTLAYNTGAAFSFLADSSGWQRWLFALIAIVVSAILVVWLKRLKKGETWLAIALALVLGGALGNLTTAWSLATWWTSSWCTGRTAGTSRRSTWPIAPSPSAPSCWRSTCSDRRNPEKPPMAESTRIGQESRVTLHFALKLEDGNVVDSTFDKQPASFKVGDGNLLPGFEQALFGLKAGDKRTLSILPEQGFGQPNPQNVQIMPRDQFQDMELAEGLLVIFDDAAKTELPGVVKAFDEQQVTVDFNHPLAGKTLAFEVEIIDVQPA